MTSSKKKRMSMLDSLGLSLDDVIAKVRSYLD